MSQSKLNKLRPLFEQELDREMILFDTPIELLKPMLYSLKSGGKRLRPMMLLATLYAESKSLVNLGFRTAMALEFVHTYSLIHDDLPAMDNDQMRRGQPTSHVKFDEATAILAGDGLLTDAFGLIASDDTLKAKQRIKLIKLLSDAAGSVGMVAGQMKDIQSESKTITLEELKEIHHYKTGELFIFAMEAAAIIGGFKSEVRELLAEFGHSYGIAYQIHNDILDYTPNQSSLDAGKLSDERNHKTTYVSLLGYSQAVEALDKELKNAQNILNKLEPYIGKNIRILSEFFDYLSIEEV